MRITFLTGIWPPDVGGPATHGPDFSRFLVQRGHDVHVVTMGDGEPAERPCEVEVVPRKFPFPVRYGLVALWAARDARRSDVVYASSTYAAAAVAALLGRRPLVVKLVSDPAYERAQRWRLFRGTLEEFQRARSRPVRLLQRLRNAALGRAVTIVVPSAFQGEIAAGWGLDTSRIHVLTNPAPPPRDVDAEHLPPGRPDELAAALRRVLAEDGLRDRLAAAAKPSVAAISSEAIYGRLESLLAGAVR